jgi:hypothetical protein
MSQFSQHQDQNIPLTGEGKRIVEHFKILNEKVKKEQVELYKKVEETSVELTQREEMLSLIRSYIKKTDNRALLDFEFMMKLERAIQNLLPMGLDMLNISAKEFKHFLISDETLSSNISEYEIKLYLENSYFKLVKIIEKRIETFSENESVYITWNLLRKVAMHYYHDQFNEEYGFYFKDIQTKRIGDFIKRYIHIDILDPDSLHNSSLFTYYLMKRNKFDGSQNYNKCHKVLLKKLAKALDRKELDDFENHLLQDDSAQSIFIDDIDLMNGYEFENFVAELFRKMGYKAEVTRASGDQGIDVIIQKNGRKIGVQAKCYSKAVANKAIQEVVAGLNYYGLDKGIVITNNYFTNSAVELAGKNNIILWDRNKLKDKLTEFFS